MRLAAPGIFIAALFTAACGYHTGGHADLVPKTVHTISIPAFTNATTRYKLTDLLPEAIAREFIARTRYRIVTDPETADAVLDGTVLGYSSFVTVIDPNARRATAVELQVTMRIGLRERTTGKMLYYRPNFEVRERYQISVDPTAYLEESDSALARASTQTARQVVSSILEAF